MKSTDEILFRLAQTRIPAADAERIRAWVSGGPDWPGVLRLARVNRLTAGFFHGLDRLALLADVPREARDSLEADYRRIVVDTEVYLDELAGLAAELREREIPFAVVRGPALGAALYGNVYLRPFSDLDLLIRKGDLPVARAVAAARGYGALPGALPDGYFARHHLHVRLTRPSRNVRLELHWALDHPFTLYTIDYAGLLQRVERRPIHDAALPVLCAEDRLLTLCLHLVKHGPFLAGWLAEQDVAALLLRARLGVWLLDVRECLRSSEALDWALIRERARAWGLEGVVTACLQAVARVYASPAPEGWGAGTHGATDGKAVRDGLGFVHRRLCALQLAALRGDRPPGRLARVLFGLRQDAVFRPVRAIDLLRFLVPPPAFMRRRYRAGAAAVLLYPVHAAYALFRIFANLAAFLGFKILAWKGIDRGGGRLIFVRGYRQIREGRHPDEAAGHREDRE
ncbi:MAG: nucleotidyltransferase family protein [Kiritimatiellae bacterium]|nr:nucleotidyltransferase family protein [Kiritimatiellia bacterium]